MIGVLNFTGAPWALRIGELRLTSETVLLGMEGATSHASKDAGKSYIIVHHGTACPASCQHAISECYGSIMALAAEGKCVALHSIEAFLFS